MQAGAPLPELDGPPHRPPPVLPYGNDLTDAEFRELKMYLHALSYYENKHISDSLYRQIADRLGSLTAPPLSEAQRAEMVQIFQQHVAAAATPAEAPPASDDAQVLQALANLQQQMQQQMQQMQQQMQQMQQMQQGQQQMQQDVNLLINRLP